MSSNYVSQSISLIRNLKKATNGDKLAAFNAVGNVVKITEKLAKVDNCWGNAAQGIVDTLSVSAANSPTLQNAGKILKVAKLGDEMGMCKSAVQVATSSSPVRKAIEETLGWAAKFTCKHIVLVTAPKIVKNTKCLNNIATKVCDFSSKHNGLGQMPAFITGIAYSEATKYGPKYARKLGGWISDKLGIKPYEEKKAEQPAQEQKLDVKNA